MSEARILDRALDMTFTSDAHTAERLRRLVSALELPYDNIAARWAISRSLSEGRLTELVPQDESTNGKELRGRTLFGALDTAALLVASLTVVEGAERMDEDLRGVVLGHWRRGQQVLADELATAHDDGDVLLRQSVERILGPQLPTVDLSAEVIGQDALVRNCEELLREQRAASGSQGHVAAGQPILVVGPEGCGRTHGALSVARAIGGDCVVVAGRKIRTVAALRAELHARAAGAAAAVVVVEDLDHASPSLVRGLRKAAQDGRIRPSKGGEIAAFSVIATSNGVIDPPGWKRLTIQHYDRDAVAKIIRNHYGWHLEVRRLVALAGRLRPALALQRARDLEKLAGTPRVTERHAALAMENWGLDRLGLDETDRRVMTTLGGSGPASLSQLSDMVGVGPARLSDSVLPYLAELGLIEEFEPGSWQATRAGLDVYGEANDD